MRHPWSRSRSADLNETNVRSLFLDCSATDENGHMLNLKVKQTPAGFESSDPTIQVNCTIVDGRLVITADIRPALKKAA